MRKYSLPSLDLLHTFEAVARHRSFSLAADELCLTQSAVSRQVKTLEDVSNFKLFQRLHRSIELTSEGAELFDSVTRGLATIDACYSSLKKAPKAPKITVSATVAFSWFWLMPRLERFSALNPDIDLRILATDHSVLPKGGEVDVAILFGSGNWDGLEAKLLFGERVYAVCSPSYVSAHPELVQIENFLDHPLLHFEYNKSGFGGIDWTSWLSMQGVTGQQMRRGLRFNSYPMVLQAAEAGRGVALGWSYITDPILAEGRLVCPAGGFVETRNGYYLCTTERLEVTPEIAAFLEWVSTEAAHSFDPHMSPAHAIHSD
jgi:DNA-binding transcriptional LysR family regulator